MSVLESCDTSSKRGWVYLALRAELILLKGDSAMRAAVFDPWKVVYTQAAKAIICCTYNISA